MFTDWTQIDPHYFWARGALWGLVAATLFWRVVFPWLNAKYVERRQRARKEE